MWQREGGKIIGASPKMLSFKFDIEVVTLSHFNILINNETHVGKELVARSIHYQSNRRKQPFVCVNHAEISINFVESKTIWPCQRRVHWRR